jgi:hypothetical protein
MTSAEWNDELELSAEDRKFWSKVYEAERKYDEFMTGRRDMLSDGPPEVSVADQPVAVYVVDEPYRFDPFADSREAWNLVVGGLCGAAFAFNRWWLWILAGAVLFGTLRPYR